MRRFPAFILAAALLLALAACVKKAPAPGPTEPVTVSQTVPAALYAYGLRATIDTSADDDGRPIFMFSRPFFEEFSALAKTANAIYARMEENFIVTMEENAEEPSDPEFPLYFKALTEPTYMTDGVVSFTTSGEWFMGGVSNSWSTGHTFDFNLRRELKIADVLHGDGAQIAAALESAFFAWVEAEGGSVDELADFELEGIREQCGPDANFYLAEEGVHVFFEPYTVPATQDGVDVFFPWGSELVKFTPVS